MLAAHLDNYELINLLLHYGDRLVRPHDVMCQCYTCKQQSGDDFLNSSLSRFHLYQVALYIVNIHSLLHAVSHIE